VRRSIFTGQSSREIQDKVQVAIRVDKVYQINGGHPIGLFGPGILILRFSDLYCYQARIEIK
jgi:hypothetical protein